MINISARDMSGTKAESSSIFQNNSTSINNVNTILTRQNSNNKSNHSLEPRSP